MARPVIRQVSFVEWEWHRQGIALEGTLKTVAELLDEHGELIDLVHADLVRGLKQPNKGRPGLNAEQVLRAFLLQRIKNWPLRELRERIADGATLRIFTGFYGEPVPKYQAFHQAFVRLRPETIYELNQMLIRAAVDMGLEDGHKLRVDTTVVETDVHYPTDSHLLWDAVRVITRLVRRLGKIVPAASAGFPDRTRRARRRRQEIERCKGRQRQRLRKYRDLIAVTEEVLRKARAAAQAARQAPDLDPMQALTVAALVEDIEHYSALADRVLDQTRRRLFDGETVPAQEKVYSIFEPHTDLIRRGKARTPNEFGHKVFLAESDHGLITDYLVLDGNPSDEMHVQPALQQHQQRFGTVPEVFAADRGFSSAETIAACRRAEVELESLPQRGGRKSPERQAYEKSPKFRQAQRFRAGIEGRISVLARGRGMKRCRLSGRERFELFVGLAVLANNLLNLARLIENAKTKPRRRRAA